MKRVAVLLFLLNVVLVLGCDGGSPSSSPTPVTTGDTAASPVADATAIDTTASDPANDPANDPATLANEGAGPTEDMPTTDATVDTGAGPTEDAPMADAAVDPGAGPTEDAPMADAAVDPGAGATEEMPAADAAVDPGAGPTEDAPMADAAIAADGAGPTETPAADAAADPAGNDLTVGEDGQPGGPNGAPVDPEVAEDRQKIAALHETRMWTDITGQHHFEGEFVSYSGGEVTLKKPGSESESSDNITLEMKKLSKADQEFIQDGLRAKARERGREALLKKRKLRQPAN